MSDEVELEAFYRRTFGFVFQKAMRLLRNEPDALEVTQEVYLRAHKGWTHVRAHPSPVGWLLTTATRLSIDRLRHAQVSRRESPKWVREQTVFDALARFVRSRRR